MTQLRGYSDLKVQFAAGPQLLWGPNAAGKTSLLEAIILMAWGHSHRTSMDADLIRWGADVARVEGTVDGAAVGNHELDLTLIRAGSAQASSGARKQIRVNGVPRRASSLGGALRVVVFSPEDMLLITGSPALRRAAMDRIAMGRFPGYASTLATYTRALQQRNGLLRAIREETADQGQLRYWDKPFLDAGAEVVGFRERMLEELAGPLAAAHAEMAPDEAARDRLGLRYETNAEVLPDETHRMALERRLAETAAKEAWNGTTLIGPHRDDLSFLLGRRNLAGFASRGQQRTAILAFKLAELDALTELDGRPPLLLLDDVFSELDPDRRSHLVRRIADLPQAFITTTTLDDLDASLLAIADTWRVDANLDPDTSTDDRSRAADPGAPSGATLRGPTRNVVPAGTP